MPKIALGDEAIANKQLTRIGVNPAGKLTHLEYKRGFLRGSVGYMVHYTVSGQERRAGIVGTGKYLARRYDLDIEMPTSVIDKRTLYTSLISHDSLLHIEIVTALSESDRFVVREFRITNKGDQVVDRMQLCSLICFHPTRGYAHRLKGRFDDKDDLFFVEDAEATIPLASALTGSQKSAGHTIDRRHLFAGGEARDALLDGKYLNNAEGCPGAVMAWDLGMLAGGESKQCRVLIAVANTLNEMKQEVAKGKAWCEENKDLCSGIDRNELTARYAGMDWKEYTHLSIPDAVNRKDLDEDGWSNEKEKAEGTDPEKKDTDGDNLIDPLDPHPLVSEKPITVTDQEVARDRPIIGSKREIVRDIRLPHLWKHAALEEGGWNLGNAMALFKYLGANSVGIHPSFYNDTRVPWKSDRFPEFFDRNKVNPLRRFIAACHKNGIMVSAGGFLWAGFGDICEIKDGVVRQTKNGWCANWVHDLNVAVQEDFAASCPADVFLILGEEYGFCAAIGSGATDKWGKKYCYCEYCQKRYKQDTGRELPDLAHKGDKIEELVPGEERLRFLRWRFKCYSELFRDLCEAVKKRRPLARTSYMGGGTGSAEVYSYRLKKADVWEELGHTADLDYVGADVYYPSKFRAQATFNYLSFAILSKICLGASVGRGVWNEAGETCPFNEPVQVYGPQISHIAHGAKVTQYFDIRYLMGGGMDHAYKREERFRGPVWARKTSPTDAFHYLKSAFDTIADINDWVINAQTPKDIAFVYCRDADDVYSSVPEVKKYTMGFSLSAHRLFMTYLLKRAYTFDVYYMKYITYRALKPYEVIVLPAAFVVSREKAGVLRRLAENGARILIMGDYGQIARDGSPHEKGVLLGLAGVRTVDPGETAVGKIEIRAGSPIAAGTRIDDTSFRIYSQMKPAEGTKVTSTHNGKDGGIYVRKLGKGEVIFMAGDFAANTISPPKWRVAATRSFKTDHGGARLMDSVMDYLLEGGRSIINYQIPDDPDAGIETALLENNARDKVLFVLNWEFEKPVAIRIGVNLPQGTYTVTERDLKERKPFQLAGKKTLSHKDLAKFTMQLDPQAVRILHIVAAE